MVLNLPIILSGNSFFIHLLFSKLFPKISWNNLWNCKTLLNILFSWEYKHFASINGWVKFSDRTGKTDLSDYSIRVQMNGLLGYINLFVLAVFVVVLSWFSYDIYCMENVRILNNYSWRLSYYSGIIPDSFYHLLFQKLFRHNVLMPTKNLYSYMHFTTTYYDGLEQLM